jgi:hypothetical protein
LKYNKGYAILAIYRNRGQVLCSYLSLLKPLFYKAFTLPIFLFFINKIGTTGPFFSKELIWGSRLPRLRRMEGYTGKIQVC